MDIECLGCGGHFESLDAIKEHARHCKSSQDNNWVIRSDSLPNKNSVPIQPIKIIFPPTFPIPKHPNPKKPFLGAFKDKELKFDVDRYCNQCHKEVIGHIQKFGYAIMIDTYWCSNCKMALWESQTYITKME